jgi:hypothetical protein
MSSNARVHSTAARLGLGALLLLSIFAWAPALYPGYWQTVQGFVPIFNVGQPAAIAGIGVAPDLWRGAGSATNLLTQPWVILGFDETTAVRLAFVLAFVIGGCAMYAWLRPVLGDLAGGLAGLIYMLQPIFLSTVYVHGSLADALVLAWLPLALAALSASARQRSIEGAAVAVLAIMALWRTQAGLAVPASILLLAYAVLVERHWVPTLAVVTASGAALVTLLPLWAIAVPSPVVFGEHYVMLAQLFSTGWAVAPSIPGWQDEYPFQLGFVIFAYCSLALWGWAVVTRRSLIPPQARLLGFAFGGGLLLVALCLGWSAPVWQLSGADRLLTYPWQILLLAAPLLAAAAGSLPVLLPDLQSGVLSEPEPGLVLRPVASWPAPTYWVVLVALVVLASYPYLAPAYTTVAPPARPVAMVGANQLAILAADVTEAGGSATLEVTWQVLKPLASDYNVFFQAITGEGEDERAVAQLDAQPAGPDRPATGWMPGEILTQRYALDLAQAPADQPLRYYFGFYDWRDGQRLPVDGGIDDKLVVYAQ